ncbi:SUMF1/EgtB/PvdO family nonheme iron enzyme [Spongisporangium articulatum]|uniref:SUMF1/EgtB/PvdO family nonheme iron enzyme n=1 Tax=Spongisporangium articulatum TaxID=3362603 RepID=A0ABW8AL13_9ACTN
MPQTVRTWTGRETRALREATRMSLRDFAAYLGVGQRTVPKWEAGRSAIQLRPETQAILDAALSRTTEDQRARFEASLNHGAHDVGPRPSGGSRLEVSTAANGAQVVRAHPVDGKQMALVGAGPFLPGPDNEVVELPAFYIDITPVTNQEYAKYMVATGAAAPAHWEAGSCPPGLLDHPVVFVTHTDAERYAAWAGKQLPSSLEREKARGTGGNVYPWGNQPSPAKCNVRESGPGRTTPVDRYHSGVSVYGVYDLSGNTWERCGTETTPGRFALKGSAFTSPFTMAQATASNDASSMMMDDDTGFRCVVSEEGAT